MHKMYQTLNWFSLPEAAQYLSASFKNETVSYANVLRFVIEEQINLSWYLRGIKAQKARAGNNVFPNTSTFEPRAQDAALLNGLYRLDLELNPSVKELLQTILLGKSETFLPLHSLVVHDDEGVLWDVLEYTSDTDGKGKAGHVPMFGAEPELSALVISKDDLDTFVSKQDGGDKNKTGLTKENRSLLRIVLAMAVERYDYNPNDEKNRAPNAISGAVALNGGSISAKTVLKFLRDAAELPDQKISD